MLAWFGRKQRSPLDACSRDRLHRGGAGSCALLQGLRRVWLRDGTRLDLDGGIEAS